ncbi:hypothetical protein GQ457_15G000310 [Hibiscus cannabinus]
MAAYRLVWAYFVGNIPPLFHWKGLSQTCDCHGVVVDVFFPKKRARDGSRFEFVGITSKMDIDGNDVQECTRANKNAMVQDSAMTQSSAGETLVLNSIHNECSEKGTLDEVVGLVERGIVEAPRILDFFECEGNMLKKASAKDQVFENSLLSNSNSVFRKRNILLEAEETLKISQLVGASTVATRRKQFMISPILLRGETNAINSNHVGTVMELSRFEDINKEANVKNLL